MTPISENYEELLKEVTRLRFNGNLESALNLIEKRIVKTNLTRREKINYTLLKATILNTMGTYHGLSLMLDELLEEIKALNLSMEYLDANLLKIISLKRLSQREEGLNLIKKMEKYLEKHKEIPLEKRTKLKAALLYQKGDYFWQTGKLDQSSDNLNKGLEIVKNTTDNQELLGMIYNRIGTIYNNKGMFEKSLVYFKKNLDIQLDLMNKREISTAYNNIGDTNFQKGEYDFALECFENSYAIDEELGNQTDMGISVLNIGMTHLYLGNKDKALEALKKAALMNEEVNNDYTLSSSWHYLIQLLLSMNAPETEISFYFNKLEQLHINTKSDVVTGRYLVSKGLILKSSKRLTEKLSAQKYFKQVVDNDSSLFDMTSVAFLNLIELLLLELKSTESEEVLNEIEILTNKVLKIATKQNLAPILVQVYLLQSKLSLLQLEIDQAKKLLDKAGELTEKKNLRKLSVAVMKQQKELYDKLGSWENLTEKKTSMRERVEMTRIEDTLLQMISHKLEVVDDVETLYKEFNINKLSLLVFRFGVRGTEFFKGIDLPKSENLERDLYSMSATFMTVMGQGSKYHTGLFGPLPVPIPGSSALVYSLTMNDSKQLDERLKGKTFSLFCILYPQHFSTMFYKRDIITKIFQFKIAELSDLTELTENFLKELREDIYKKITEVFTPFSILEKENRVSTNLNQ